MKKRVFSALSALLVVGFLAACSKPQNPGVLGFASGVTSIGDGKVVVSRNGGGLLGGKNMPPFVIDCTREKSSFC